MQLRRNEVQAAGGIVLRQIGCGPTEVAVIHRPSYDDWTLPKGKLNPGETHEAAALREVKEETGLVCQLGRPAGEVRYRDRKGRPKLVRYWVMQPSSPTGNGFVPNDEVDRLRWLPLAEAQDVLTYAHDREILAALRA
ncbi:MAG TPA: NUDIX hydrolase [Actinomycetota bacterium]|nr:NUDIX hydrolase [Actinomycetota bacterium]